MQVLQYINTAINRSLLYYFYNTICQQVVILFHLSGRNALIVRQSWLGATRQFCTLFSHPPTLSALPPA